MLGRSTKASRILGESMAEKISWLSAWLDYRAFDEFVVFGRGVLRGKREEKYCSGGVVIGTDSRE